MSKAVRTPQGQANKLLGLEIVRFISAISVLFWHYQHFFFVADKATGFVREQQPFYSLFSLFYDYGNYGVQVFWCISGYIFFWKYRSALADGLVGAKKFFVLRFSRLYPLHVATLVLVGALQMVYFAQQGYYFVYQHNDWQHLVLQLFMASHWGFQQGYSFNGPIWSISVEVLVYLVFFLGLRFIGKSMLVSAAVLLACAAAKWMKIPSPIIDCLAYFYVGGLAAVAAQALEQTKWLRVANWTALAIVLAGPALAYSSLARHDWFVAAFLLGYLPFVLFLAAREVHLPQRLHVWGEAAGNMTYSSYLVHFPIQLGVAIWCAWQQRPIPVHSNKFFLLFVATTMVAAYFVYRYFELPAQNAIRMSALGSGRKVDISSR